MSLKQPHKIRVPYNDLEIISHASGGGGNLIMGYQDQLFTGYAIIDYFPDTKDIQFEDEYKNGEHIGWDNEYYPTGELKSECLTIGIHFSMDTTEYDINGNVTSHIRVVSDTTYSELVAKYNLLD
ncbi:hypothetical protein [Parasediminibacterium sp. JCM 36343]|uniref:hypothetical protein n=1 Tax=Parasediminibacterium sp. JCM 36343 TaxID=3374279 RepID=UPI00397A80B0